MAMGEADAEGAVGDDFREGEVWRVHVVVAFDELQIGCDGSEEVVGGFVGEVAEAEDLTDFAGGEEFFELGEVRRLRDLSGT